MGVGVHYHELGQLIPFVHPTIATIAAATGLIPVLIHLINRRRYRRVPWAAMSFLLTAKRRSARRMAIEHWILLAIRILIVVLFGLAIARPYLPANAWAPIAVARSHHILLIDNSLSMQAGVDGKRTRFERAMDFARPLIDRMPRGDAVSIVTMAHPATALVAHPAYDSRFVKEQLASIEVTQRGTDVVGAVSAARKISRESDVPVGNQIIYMISDFQQRHWLGGGAGDTDAGLGGVESGSNQVNNGATPAVLALRALARSLPQPQTNLHLVVAGQSEVTNVAITDLSCETGFVAAGLPLRVVARISNRGSATQHGLQIELRRGSEIIRKQDLPAIAPQNHAVATMTTILPHTGSFVLEARLNRRQGDMLALDDARFLALEARQSLPVLLVDGRPGATSLAGQAGYLATALAPNPARFGRAGGAGAAVGPADRSWIQPKVVNKSEFDREILDDYDVIALCNVHRLGERGWQRLRRFVAKGRGLCVFAGDLVDARDFNRFGFADGAGPLPGTWNEGGAESPMGSKGTSLDVSHLTHPIVSAFAQHTSSGLFRARFDRYLAFAPDLKRCEIVLRYRTGDPALVAAAYHKGRVLVFTSTAGMEWNNLPAKGDYVSLMISAFSYLTSARGANRNLMVGDVLREPLTPRESSLPLHVQAAGESPTPARLAPREGGLSLEYGPLEHVGRWDVSVGASTRGFACNVDAAESDIRASGLDMLQRVTDRIARVYPAHGDDDTGAVRASAGELGAAALYLAIVLLLAECALAMWFGSERAGATSRPLSHKATHKAT